MGFLRWERAPPHQSRNTPLAMDATSVDGTAGYAFTKLGTRRVGTFHSLPYIMAATMPSPQWPSSPRDNTRKHGESVTSPQAEGIGL
jgi:hypothetical protein